MGCNINDEFVTKDSKHGCAKVVLEYVGCLFAALHEFDPVFKEFSSSGKFSSTLFSLGYKRPVVIQSMYIFKVSHFLAEDALRSSLNVFTEVLLVIWNIMSNSKLLSYCSLVSAFLLIHLCTMYMWF